MSSWVLWLCATSACQNEAVAKYGDKIAVGIDALHGKVAAEGWIEQSEVDYITLAKEMEAVGVKTIIFTDISRDGTLTGAKFGDA